LRGDPGAKLKYVAACHGLARRTLSDRYHGYPFWKDPHLESRKLAPEKEQVVVELMDSQDALRWLSPQTQSVGYNGTPHVEQQGRSTM